jgi:thiol-disulfide isomerase/thioredoxin
LLFGALATALTCWPASAAEKKPPAQNPPAQPPAAQEPAAPGDPFAVPEGTPEELFEYIERMKALPPGLPPQAVEEYAKKANRAIVKAAEKILAAKPDDQQVQTAVQTKMWGLFLLQHSGDAEAAKQLAGFPAELQKAGRPKLAREVRRFSLEIHFQGGLPGDTQSLEKTIAQVKQYLAEAPLEEADVELMMAAARTAEMTGKTDLAVDAYRSFAKVLAASPNEQLAQMAKLMEAVVRRLTLVGQKMKVEGTILGGGVLDWSKYAGKVVLVDFWATWCGPCLRELPNVIKIYELYHGRGFEVIGVSCDHNREDLEKFLQENAIPWPVLYGDNGPSPTVEYYGITGIPTMILVGANGNVISITARGPQLRQELEKLLGPLEDKNEKETGKAKEQGKEVKKPGVPGAAAKP